MKRLIFILGGLASINIFLAFLAARGLFEGKDLLPILLAVFSVLIAAVILLVKRKDNTRFKWLGFLLILLSAIGLYHSHFSIFSKERNSISRESSIKALEGKKAPSLLYAHVINLDDTITASELFENNRYTILNFWATWCAPCLKEMPVLEEFYLENRENDIGIVGFTDYKYGDTNELAKIRGLVKDLNISYPILIDSTTNVRVKYKADILPATVLMDKDGNVLDYQIGLDGAKKIMDFVANN
jgi:thiol-disulfide isomerase/thioredoxin